MDTPTQVLVRSLLVLLCVHLSLSASLTSTLQTPVSTRSMTSTAAPTCPADNLAQACVYSQGGQDFVAICALPNGCGSGYRCCKTCCLVQLPDTAPVPYCRHLTPPQLC